MKYFSLDMQINDIEQTFRQLSMELHPDKAIYDSQDDFIQLKAEYDAMKAIKAHWRELNQYFEQVYYTPQPQRPAMDLQDMFVTGMSFINDVSGTVKQVQKVAKNVNKAFKQVG